MPATPVTETLDGGLVTARHPALLREGELQRTNDCIYRRFATSIDAVGGRTAFNSTALRVGNPVKGLGWLSFDGSTDQVIALSGTAVYASDFAALSGGSFHTVPGTDTLTDAGTETLEVIQYGNAYYALNGSDMPQRLGLHTPVARTVANCTIAGDGVTVTTTTPFGFISIIAGQTVSGTGVVASTRVLVAGSILNLWNTVTLDTAATPGSGLTLTFATTPFLHGRRMCLLPVPGWKDGTAATTSGTWNNNPTDFGPGYYWFLYTEMVLDGAIDDTSTEFIESGWGTKTKISGVSARPIVVQVTANTVVPVVTRNTVIENSNATHWQVYMGPRTDTSDTAPLLETFQRIGSPIVIQQTSYTFNEVVNSQGPSVGTATHGSPDAAFDSYDNLNNVLADDGNYMTSHAEGSKGSAMLLDFSFTSTGIAPVGIEVTVKGIGHLGGLLHSAKLGVSVERVSGGIVAKQTPFKIFSFSPQTQTLTLGGPLDTWGPSSSWAASDVVRTDANNCLRLVVLENWNHVNIDYIKVKLYFTGQNINKNGRFLRTITYRSQLGDVVTDSAAQPLYSVPTTADVFQGKFVCNDTQNESRIVYSLPGFPEYFPIPYEMVFNSRLKDRIRVIRRVGQVLVVGMQASVKRVNYLPDESDTTFQNGLAHEDLATDHGMVGTQGVCHFDLPNSGTVLAYVSFKGLHVTDGITTRFLTVDLDWENTVNTTYLSTAVLRNDQQNNWLILYYCPAGASHGKNTRALYFSYAPGKLKDTPWGPMLSVTGPSQVSGRSVCTVNLSGLSYVLTGHQTDGKVYVEDQGLALPTSYTDGDSAATIHPSILTRRIYGAGYNRDTREERVYLLHDSVGATLSVSAATVASNLTTVTKTGGFTSAKVGMLVTGSTIQPGTIVATKPDNNTITLSSAATAAGSVNLTLDDGTISVTIRGQGIGESSPTTFDTSYTSTRVGDVLVVHNDNFDQGLEILIEKPADLGQTMKLHNFMMLVSQQGTEQNRG